MNEVTFVEAARMLAERMVREGGTTSEERIAFAFRLITARQPRPFELRILHHGFLEHAARFRSDPNAALKLLSTGEHRRDAGLEPSELAAYAAIAGLILNLDEAITKE